MIELEGPVAAYFEAERGNDYEKLAQCFAEDAVLHDERRDIEGRAAIRDWLAEAKRRYQHETTVLSASTEGDKVRVETRVAGQFSGSPVMLRRLFTVAGGEIVRLEITP